MDATQTGRKESTLNPTADQLRAHADASHAAYPQYAGYFDGWKLGALTHRVITKGGTRLSTATVVLANFEHDDLDGDPMVALYDPATTHIVVVPAAWVAPVQHVLTRYANGLVWFEEATR